MDQMNSIFLISPFKRSGMWVFNDPERGLIEEPFVAGADTVIDMAAAQIPHAAEGFNLLFSSTAFPDHKITLRLTEPGDDKSGNTYTCDELGVQAWLCPALYRYYEVAPAMIYADFRPMNGRKNKTNEKKRRS